ncbi:MAG TPA: FAD-binding and (Fe-S)-binding domain-containing protein [Gammaproteobacteria bacterium]|nr:FAD-binding and (Fe-S)-binding domain-containing protein [Gammaproteobacteria bacterium]
MQALPLASLQARLRREIEGDVLFEAGDRGRYSTDASIYQIEPLGVVVPRTDADALRALEIAAEAGVPLLPRGAGTSQCGQTVAAALVLDTSKHLNRLLDVDVANRTAWVEPGLVLDELNARLKPHGLWYPVDVSTSAQATLGGMAANNSCGARSLRYGNMVHNVLAAETWLTSGETVVFGEVARDGAAAHAQGTAAAADRHRELVALVRALRERERDEIAARVPHVQRRVAGYNLDMASSGAFNMAHLLVGSEGTLGYFRKLKLKLAPLPRHKVLGIVHFPTFHRAMELTRHIVELEPTAVELVDRTMIGLSREIASFRATVDKTIRGEPGAVLLVEFAGEELAPQAAKLERLDELIADLGLPGSVVAIEDPALQRDVWEVRKAGLNIMMSMKGDGKPVSFIEDCAVPLEHLADYTDRLTRVFEKHGTRGTWYAHASVGCLHVRPVLDMRTADGALKMRAIAEEACALVKEYKGSYSGEHGDGLVRSEWIAPMLGSRLAGAFAELKRAFDPKGLMNPGKIVAPQKMDDRRLFRFKPGYDTTPLKTALDWSEHEVGEHNRGRGFAAAVEMCNNNGHCRKFDAGTMCPSYRVTRDERHATRGRANSLRLALSGQLGAGALDSRELYDTLALCVSCKGCKRECPTGVDMARMKIEFLHQYHRRHPRTLEDKLVAHLPRYARRAAALAPLLNLRDRVPGLAALSERVLGFAARRSLPRWRRDWFRGQREVPAAAAGADDAARDVVLLADTFNTYFEPENLRAAVRVLAAAGYRTQVADGGERPLCCGRTYLATGMVEEARAEAARLRAALAPQVARGVAVVGLEPSCVLGLRDEFRTLLPGTETEALAAAALTFEEFVVRERAAGRFRLELRAPRFARALVHGHCHQKAFGAMPSVVAALRLVPGLKVETIESSCCGMAGAFGYQARHVDVSLRMAELALLPAVRAAGADTVIVADGTSCRHQILDGTAREALHVARVLADCLPEPL